MRYGLSALYVALFYLSIPFIVLRLLWRSVKSPAYRFRWKERFGFYRGLKSPVDIWFHAVSVGEAEALFPLVRLIQQKRPAIKIVVTCTTPTGSARIKSVLGDSVAHVYLPYDLPCVVRRFLSHFEPKLAVIMETEIWPNLYMACVNQQVPLFLVNARLSEKSMRGYLKLSALIKPVLARITMIAAQTVEDVRRFAQIGGLPERIKVMGNIKFDVQISEEVVKEARHLKQTMFKNRFVWLLASTHKGEEEIVLKNYSQLKQSVPELLLVMVPRHPERFTEVEKLCQQFQCNVVRRSLGGVVAGTTDVYLADTMGELKMLYATADVAFVGGSMVNVGGHNILEPAAVGAPVMFGPYMHNFKEIAGKALKQQAAIQCQNSQELMNCLLQLHREPCYRQQLVDQGKIFVKENQGAIDKIYSMMAAYFPEPSG